MSVVAFITVVVLCLTGTQSHSLHRRSADRPQSYFNTDPLDSDSQSLADALGESRNMTYSDFVKKVTIIKDVALNSCFVADLDPGLSLTSEERVFLTNTEVPTTVTSDTDLASLLDTLGPDLTTMCRQENIYWLLSPPTKNTL